MKKRHNLQVARSILVKGTSSRRLSISALALGLTLVTTTHLSAQTNFVVDLADPNVSVDLSVLNDGGLAPQMGAPAPMGAPSTQTSAGGYQAPGKETPVSRLYIKPTSKFRLPPQTKPIEAPVATAAVRKPAPAAPMPKLEPVPEGLPAPRPPIAPAETKSTTPPPPPPAAAIATPAPLPAPEAEPEVVAQPEPAPAPAPAPQEKTEVAAILETVPPALEPEKPVEAMPPAPPAPEPAPVEAVEEVAKAEPIEEPVKQPVQLEAPPPVEDEIKEVAAAPTPPPPPAATPTPAPEAPQAALTPPPAPPASAPAPVEHDETDTATASPKAAGDDAMVIPPKPEAEVAAVPSSTGPLSEGQSLRILFDADSSKLPPAARDQLSGIASKLQNQDNMRLQLLAYAANPDMSASAARRLSLSRALAVRSFLIENGVRSTRIDVRALGNKSSDPQTERVDITVVER